MKKFLLVFVLISFLMPQSVQAKTIKVISLQNFSTAFPLEFYNVETLEEINLGNGIILQPGTIVAGKVIKIDKPKRGKINARFEFVPALISYKGAVQKIENPNYTAEIIGYRKIDPEQAAIYVAKKATNFIFLGASLGVSFVQGAMDEAREGERVKSGLIQVYKDTPLSFVEVGSDLNIETGDALKLKLKRIN